MPHVYMYAVTYDLGFAPNPFGGLCSLACCKPEIRRKAEPGDWVLGLTGTRLRPALRLVFAMQVTRISNFDDYWSSPEFAGRRAKRNGSQKSQVGDNIYHRDGPDSPWVQEDSVHSRAGGAQCDLNTDHDTRVNRILLSDRFIYLGERAVAIPAHLLQGLGYCKNPRDRRKFAIGEAAALIAWVEDLIESDGGLAGDPINFDQTAMNFSFAQRKMV